MERNACTYELIDDERYANKYKLPQVENAEGCNAQQFYTDENKEIMQVWTRLANMGYGL